MSDKESMINLDYLESLIAGYEEDRIEFLEVMIETFLEEMPLELKNLDSHLQNQDWNSIQKNAHKIKSMISSMGMKETLEFVREIENLAEKGEDFNSIGELLLRVKENCELAFDESKKALKELK